MSLQIIAGPSGSGKSTIAYNELIQAAADNPRQRFILVVPDQFSMSSTERICRMHPAGGIMNIEVLSFSRLVHRIGDETGKKQGTVLDDTGKNLILRRVSLSLEDQLTFLKGRMKRPGYVHEVKSQLSEFYQYDISQKTLEELIEKSRHQGYLAGKLSDLKLLYQAFSDYIRDHFITTEEALSRLADWIPESSLLAGSEVLFDNFTGFTPVQERVLFSLLQVCKKVSVILCMDEEGGAGAGQLFALPQKTRDRFVALAGRAHTQVEPIRFIRNGAESRFSGNEPMAFLEQNLLRFTGKAYGKKPDTIKICEASSRREEVQWCCRQIRALLRQGYEYRQIAIETGDPEGYAPLLSRELAHFGIPYYLDQNRSVLQNPAVSCLRFALQILTENFSCDSVMGYLRSGMTDFSVEEIDRLDLYLTKYGIRGKSAYTKPFSKGEEAEKMDALRAGLMEQLAPLLTPANTAAQITEALYAFCLGQKLFEKCNAAAKQFTREGLIELAGEYEKIYESLMELLDQIHDLIGEDAMDLKEYLAVFEAGVSEIRLGMIPRKVDQVLVGDIRRTRLGNIKALFFIGINEGIIPAKDAGGGLLSDREREFLLESGADLAPGPREKLLEQRLYLYQTMTRPSELLYLSYATLDGAGKSLPPSYLIRHVTALYPDLSIEPAVPDPFKAIACEQDGLFEMARLLRSYTGKDASAGQRESVKSRLLALSAAYGEKKEAADLIRAAYYVYVPSPLSEEARSCIGPSGGTVSRLELMAACPFAYFVRYVLSLKEKETRDFESKDMGTVYHSVLERLLQSLREEGKRIEDLSDEELTDRIHSLMLALSSGYDQAVLTESARNRYRASRMEKVLWQSASVMRHQLSKGRFTPLLLEYPFEEKGKPALYGIIDRVDVAEQEEKVYVKIIDYKSGARKLDASELYHGLSLQLPIYMIEAGKKIRALFPGKEILPGAMLYYCLKNPILDSDKEADLSHALLMDMRPEGLVRREDALLDLLDASFAETGKSDVVRAEKKKDGSFKDSDKTAEPALMEAVLLHAQKKAGQLHGQVEKGAFPIRPVTVQGSQTDSCTYCRYRGICGFDERISGFALRELPKVELADFSEELEDYP